MNAIKGSFAKKKKVISDWRSSKREANNKG